MNPSDILKAIDKQKLTPLQVQSRNASQALSDIPVVGPTIDFLLPALKKFLIEKPADRVAKSNQRQTELNKNAPDMGLLRIGGAAKNAGLDTLDMLRDTIKPAAEVNAYLAPFGQGVGVLQKATVPGAISGTMRGISQVEKPSDLLNIPADAALGAIAATGAYGLAQPFMGVGNKATGGTVPAQPNSTSVEALKALYDKGSLSRSQIMNMARTGVIETPDAATILGRNPDLNLYERAFEAGNKAVMDALSKLHPGDNNYMIHLPPH